MLRHVDTGKLSLAPYRRLVDGDLVDEVRELARSLKHARVLHLNATPYGGGVAELLRSEVALLRGLGVDADWKVISGDEGFFHVTKDFHNALQGARYHLTERAKETYLANNALNAHQLEQEYDFLFIHDPQPAALRTLHHGSSKWIWRCHIDTSHPNEEVWAFLKPYVEAHDAAIFTMREFVPPDLKIGQTAVIPPAIDALSPKNMALPLTKCREILTWIGVDTARPLITQISRFDAWKDPHGVIEAHKLARKEVPGLQLALVGSMALDDPEGWRVYSEIVERQQDDPDSYVFTNLTGIGNVEVNAFQRIARVVVQKSIREGFGLVVSEALWKGTPVVAGRAGGIPLQLTDGKGGYLVESVEECADRIVRLLTHAEQAEAMGEAGRAHVAAHFLMPRLIRDELRLLAKLA
ncbi:MAG TPA: glycosyltransferase [Chloroflexota bacterium]|jgi:trehalose synthase